MTGDSGDAVDPAGAGDRTAADEARRPRGKEILISTIAIAGVLALAAATQTWLEIELVPGSAAETHLSVTGQKLNPSLSPIAIAVLAAALALTIAGPFLRRLLGALVVLCGGGIALLGATVLLDPHLEPTSAIAEVTGIVGGAQYELIRSVAATFWPGAAAACGIAAALAGGLVVLGIGAWRTGGRKYESQAGRSPRRASEGPPDRIADWDALSEGDDPT